MARTPAVEKQRSSFLARHEDNMRRIDSAITRLRKTAQAARSAARTSRKSSR